jgi:chromosome segregation ATPase
MSQALHPASPPIRERETANRIAALIEELDNLKRSLPAHSIKPAMLIRIEELEEEIESLKRETSDVTLDV